MASIFHKHNVVTHILIDCGVDVRECCSSLYHDCTALHMAAALGFAAIAELLLKKGMDVEALGQLASDISTLGNEDINEEVQQQ